MEARSASFERLSQAEQDAAVGTDHAYLGALEQQRATALTWLGRCAGPWDWSSGAVWCPPAASGAGSCVAQLSAMGSCLSEARSRIRLAYWDPGEPCPERHTGPPLAAPPRRCYLDGVGVPREVAQAAELFRAAGNREELRELAMLREQFAALELSDADV